MRSALPGRVLECGFGFTARTALAFQSTTRVRAICRWKVVGNIPHADTPLRTYAPYADRRVTGNLSA